ncbi:phospho-N-acetylmuramoyl-pentapeptide-transferase [Pseudoflavonifractor sp. DSM 107456]|uniref:Phospho-N-acetylmuramoyl-pentapeptide-transferase n=1 Tax=Pseudoflavonifractor gallinarum TaxID=2779352 RepID=A0ABR9R8S0_9FIRM|nr:phospho-N-acetylmuramoyl-pentapeptide-transferase [Pseudoflavonifractor gallinarum]MBE5055095.1 phospho-N-acetylmuramoyl-pentapeptide-transferase [Pseudoflavonifractor gallinarum]
MDLSIVLSILLGFVVSAVAGRLLIPVLRRLKAGQAIKEIGPTWHMTKQGTPTMGGLMFIIAIAVVLVVIGWKDLMAGRLGGLYTYLFALVFGAIGFLDDYMKVKKKENTGLTAGPKFLLQLAAAIVFTILLRNEGYLSPDLYIPFVNVTFQLPWVVYMVFAAFVMVGTVNAVNITDGIDGLSSSVTVPVAMFFTVVAVQWDRGEIGVVSGALVGGLLGFLIYNFHPAKVFMGDTGSLFMGGMVCGLAFALDMPLILILVGIIYIAETLSDIIQVTYFKATHGKRIFRMAPLHHHFEMGGWSEVKLVVVFTSVTVVFCVLAYLGVANRFPV